MNSELELCLKHLKALVACDTSNPPKQIQASGLLDYLNSLSYLSPSMTDLGDGSFNILLKKGDPQYLFNVHLDTVPAGDGWQTDPWTLTIKNDQALGLGACDIKGAAACLLTLIEQGLENYAVLFSTDEEAGQSRCIKEFLNTQPNYAGVIVSEPTNNLGVTCHRGIYTGTQTFSGISGHSSDHRAMQDNAIHKLTHWCHAALESAMLFDDEMIGPLKGLAFNLGLIEGGVKPNIIADSASVKFGFRPLPGQSVETILEAINTQSIDKESCFTPGFVAPSLPANGDLKTLELMVQTLGLDLSEPVNFWTEASLFSQAGLPAIVFGPGDIAHAHQPNEHVDLSQLSQALNIYRGIVQ
jgi:acetylornithine deacetylase|tara:strand:+ start:1197 stop:2264 length:1068 start_codon:yes stop_codon:yes gene_type:complete